MKENTIPIFSYPLPDVEVPLTKTFNYKFPKIIDPDYGAKTSISSVEEAVTGTLPSFITLEKTTLKINPTLIE